MKAATVVVLATAISAAISSSVAELYQLLELQLDLIERSVTCVRSAAHSGSRVSFSMPQLLVGDQGLTRRRRFGSCHREFRFGVGGPGRFDDVPVSVSRPAPPSAPGMSFGKASPPEIHAQIEIHKYWRMMGFPKK